MKNCRILSLIAVVLTVSIFSVYVIADGNNECLTLAWNANPEADGYLIYGYSNGQPYGYIGMTQLLVDPMFTDTSASSVIENHYWVFAYYIENNQIIPGLPSEELVGRAI